MPGADANSQLDGSVKRWRVGDVTITRIVELQTLFDIPTLFPEASVEAVLASEWLQPHFVTPEGRGIISMHSLVIDAPGKRIIVDTCLGAGRERAGWAQDAEIQTSFLRKLEDAGFPCDGMDVVLCTHLHYDHVGWNTVCVDGEWKPTFPRARYLLNRTEYEFWAADREPNAAGLDEIQRLAFEESVRPLLDAGLVDLVEGTHRICEEVTLVPTPGHSPGHVSVHISSRGEQALITGDIAHHPSQLAHLEWGSPHVDFDCEQATATRRRVFSELADKPVLVIGTHWAGPTAGWVKRCEHAFRLEC